MKKLTIIFLSLIFTSLSLTAQEVKEVRDTIDGDKYIPITRQQAEELITRIVVEARKPHIKARQTERMLREFKVEALKRRLLDQALRDTYVDEYKERMDRLERLVMTLVLAQSGGKADPAVIQNIISQGGSSQAPVVAGTPAVATSNKEEAEHHDSVNKLIADLVDPTVESEEPTETDTHHTPQTIDIKDAVYFEVSSHTLSDVAKSTLDEVVAKALFNPLVKIELKGYASPEGNMAFNNRLSQRRVDSVATYLKEKGIAASRLVLVPSGIDSMKAQRKDARRVELTTVK